MSNVAPLTLLSATVVLNASLEGWSLLEPSSQTERTFQHFVSFDRPFWTPPVVQVALVGLDVSKDDNLRIRVGARDITVAGFTLFAETWLNTKIWAVEVSWLAVGG
jgi:hypothetical protein